MCPAAMRLQPAASHAPWRAGTGRHGRRRSSAVACVGRCRCGSRYRRVLARLGPAAARQRHRVQGGSSVAISPRYVWDNGRAVVSARWSLRHADEVGDRVRLRGRPAVTNRGRMVIGERVQLVSTIATLELVADEGGLLEIGDAHAGQLRLLAGRDQARADRRRLPHRAVHDDARQRLPPRRAGAAPRASAVEADHRRGQRVDRRPRRS